MQHYSRRDFIKTTVGLTGLTFVTGSFNYKKRKPFLSFSTLGCPDWSFQKIINFAAENNYNGIELRGLQRELDLTKSAAFSNNKNILASRKLAEEKRIKIIALGSSAQLHHSDASERLKNLDEAKRFIELAHQLNCPYIRVFPNNFPKGQERNATIDLIVQGLIELSNFAKGSGICVLMETHGDVVWISDLDKIMKEVEQAEVGLVWDIHNMWEVSKESPVQAYKKLKQYIRHVHIKDGRMLNGNLRYTLLGKGDSPVFAGIDALYKDGYKGYYSFEWEKLWRPEIEEPEIALADYSKVMMQYFP